MKQLTLSDSISDKGGKLADNFIILVTSCLENATSLWLISWLISLKHLISNPRLYFQMTYDASHSFFFFF